MQGVRLFLNLLTCALVIQVLSSPCMILNAFVLRLHPCLIFNVEDVALYTVTRMIHRGCSSVVRALASHGNGPGSIPGPGIVQLWMCVLLNEVTPRRSDGT